MNEKRIRIKGSARGGQRAEEGHGNGEESESEVCLFCLQAWRALGQTSPSLPFALQKRSVGAQEEEPDGMGYPIDASMGCVLLANEKFPLGMIEAKRAGPAGRAFKQVQISLGKYKYLNIPRATSNPILYHAIVAHMLSDLASAIHPSKMYFWIHFFVFAHMYIFVVHLLIIG